MARKTETAVIGGGLQGVSAALALAERGVPSTIIEGRGSLLQGASATNEGKIHLGFVYALDPGGDTAATMIEGALAFAPLVDRWCGGVDWKALRTEPFAYLVMPDGLLTPAELAGYYEKVCELIELACERQGADYLGVDPRIPAMMGDGAPAGMDLPEGATWFKTPERALDPRPLRSVLMESVERSPLIEVATGASVTGVDRSEAGFVLHTSGRDGSVSAGQVLNCAWEGRAELDSLAGLEPERLIYRIKHRAIVSARGLGGMPPTTIVHGPFGDLVPFGSDEVYLSWYPVSRTWTGSEPGGSIEGDRAVTDATVGALAQIVPGLTGAEVVEEGGGYIVAPDLEESGLDIDRLESPLHQRERLEVVESDGWWSLRSHKLTTAPLLSDRCAERVARVVSPSVRIPA